MSAAPKLIVACMAQNESRKFWRSALDVWGRFADTVLVLDDNSTDNTAELALAAGAKVFSRSGRAAWGSEAPARQQLFDLAMQEAEPKDWVLFLDADMVPARDPRELALLGTSNAWAFAIYDLWSLEPLRYRWDEYWVGHEHPRIWMIERPTVLDDWAWSPRGIHCGHLPTNFRVDRQIGVAPKEYALLHFAYCSHELRQAKFKQYESVLDKLSNHEWRHAVSITDPNPKTYALPFTPDFILQPEQLEAAA